MHFCMCNMRTRGNPYPCSLCVWPMFFIMHSCFHTYQYAQYGFFVAIAFFPSDIFPSTMFQGHVTFGTFEVPLSLAQMELMAPQREYTGKMLRGGACVGVQWSFSARLCFVSFQTSQ